VATGKGGVIQLWDVHDRERPRAVGRPLVSHGEENIASAETVASVAFSPDGDALASVGYDLTARVWILDADRAAGYVCEHTGGVLTRADWEEHLPQLGYREACGGR
jgi:WD40 repeat protein